MTHLSDITEDTNSETGCLFSECGRTFKYDRDRVEISKNDTSASSGLWRQQTGERWCGGASDKGRIEYDRRDISWLCWRLRLQYVHGYGAGSDDGRWWPWGQRQERVSIWNGTTGMTDVAKNCTSSGHSWNREIIMRKWRYFTFCIRSAGNICCIPVGLSESRSTSYSLPTSHPEFRHAVVGCGQWNCSVLRRLQPAPALASTWVCRFRVVAG